MLYDDYDYWKLNCSALIIVKLVVSQYGYSERLDVENSEVSVGLQ